MFKTGKRSIGVQSCTTDGEDNNRIGVRLFCNSTRQRSNMLKFPKAPSTEVSRRFAFKRPASGHHPCGTACKIDGTESCAGGVNTTSCSNNGFGGVKQAELL